MQKKIFGPRAPVGILTHASNAHPLMLWSRQSREGSAAAHIGVGRDAVEMYDALNTKLDIDVRSVAPGMNTVARALDASSDRISSIEYRTGHHFDNTFAVFDLRRSDPSVPVVVVACAGTSVKLDHRRQQPALHRMADLVDELEPSLVFGKTFGRLSRDGWAWAPFWVAVRYLNEHDMPVEVWHEGGREGEGNFGQAITLLKGESSRTEAKSIMDNTRRSMLTWTKNKMLDGRVPFGLAGNAPMGLARTTLASSSPIAQGFLPGHRSPLKLLYIDTPTASPGQAERLDAVPDVRRPDGEPADQVQALRWYLAHAGQSGLSLSDLSAGLYQHGLSSDLLRRRNGHRATFADTARDPAEALAGAQSSIWKRLGLYETGILEQTLKEERVVITNVLPTDGPWADPEDFERIRAWLLDRGHRGQSRAKATFSGMPVQMNGNAAMLRPMRPRSDADLTCVRYTAAGAATGDEPGESQSDRPNSRTAAWITHQQLAESIVDGLLSAAAVPVPRARPNNNDIEGTLLRANLELAERKIALLHAQRDMQWALIIARRPDGSPQYTDAAADQLNAVYNKLTNEIQAKERTVDDQRRRLSTHEAEWLRVRQGLRTSSALQVVASLRQPDETKYRELWRTSLQQLTVNSEPIRYGTLTGMRVTWTASLHVSDDGQTVAIPVRGEAVCGAASRIDDHERQLERALRDGVPLRNVQRAYTQALRSRIAFRLAGSTTRAPFLGCDEPALLEFGMRVLFPEHGVLPSDACSPATWSLLLDDPRWTELFTRPDVLAARMHSVHSLAAARPSWLVPCGRREVEALATAAQGEGQVLRADVGTAELNKISHTLAHSGRNALWIRSRAGLRLPACSFCGGHARALCRIREIDGYLCLRCRHDCAGVTWPAGRFDRYLAAADLWQNAGFPVEMGPDGPAEPISNSSRERASSRAINLERSEKRRFSDLSDEQQQRILSAYEAGAFQEQLAAEHGLREPELRSTLQQRGLLRARSGRK